MRVAGGVLLNWLDWLIIVILVFSTLRGWRLGLVASVARLAGILIGLVVAITYRRDLVEYLTTRWDLGEKILPFVTGLLKFWFPAAKPVPLFVSPGRLTAAVPVEPYQLDRIGGYLAGTIVAGVLEALSFLALLLAVVWAVNLAARLLTGITDICPLGLLNRLGGLFFGAARGLVAVIIVLALMLPFQQPNIVPGTRPENPGVNPGGKAFAESKLLPYFNPFLEAIGRPVQGDNNDFWPNFKNQETYDTAPLNESDCI